MKDRLRNRRRTPRVGTVITLAMLEHARDLSWHQMSRGGVTIYDNQDAPGQYWDFGQSEASGRVYPRSLGLPNIPMSVGLNITTGGEEVTLG